MNVKCPSGGQRCVLRSVATTVVAPRFSASNDHRPSQQPMSRTFLPRENGSDKKAEELAKKAWNANSHVPATLTGTKKAKSSTSGYITMGGEDEAAHYVEEWGFDWLTTPGAIDWLMKVAAEMASTRSERRSVH